MYARFCVGVLCHVDSYARSGNNWAVLVETSRYWYNYRHAANAPWNRFLPFVSETGGSFALFSMQVSRRVHHPIEHCFLAQTLSFYHTVKRLGIPDSQIILMMAEDPWGQTSASGEMLELLERVTQQHSSRIRC